MENLALLANPGLQNVWIDMKAIPRRYLEVACSRPEKYLEVVDLRVLGEDSLFGTGSKRAAEHPLLARALCLVLGKTPRLANWVTSSHRFPTGTSHRLA